MPIHGDQPTFNVKRHHFCQRSVVVLQAVVLTCLLWFQGYQVAYVIFKDKSGVGRATSMPYSCQRLLSSDDCRLVTGLESKCKNICW